MAQAASKPKQNSQSQSQSPSTGSINKHKQRCIEIPKKLSPSMINGRCIEMEGWLLKKSRVLKKWRLRWCVLSGDTLYSFKNERKYNEDPTETISVADILDVAPLDDSTNTTADRWAFTVEMDKKLVFTLAATSESVRSVWISAVSKLLALNREMVISVDGDHRCFGCRFDRRL